MELQSQEQQTSALSKHWCSLAPGFPLLYEQPGSCTVGTAAGVALEIKIAPLVAELGGGRWQVDMAAVSRHWPEELGGGRVRGENGAESVEDWGLVRKDRNQVSGGEGGRGAGGTKVQGGKEGRSERCCEE